MELEALLSTLNEIAAVVVVLGLCLYFHEAGHFIAAKAFGCKVHDFAFGFGPSLVAKRLGGTTYRLNAVPFGGYVRIAGMEPGAEAVEGGFHSIPRYQSAIILFSGVAMNVVLAVIMFTIVALWTGVGDPSDDSITIGKVVSGSPAEQGGLLPGDRIVAIEHSRDSLAIESVKSGGAASRAGLKAGMVISAVEGRPVYVPISVYEGAVKSQEGRVEIAALDYTAATLADQQTIIRLPRPKSEQEPKPERTIQLLEEAWGITFAKLDTTAVVGAITMRPNQPVDFTVLRQGAETDVTVTPEAEWARYPIRDRSGTIKAPHVQIGRIGVVLEAARRRVGFGEALVVGSVGSYGAVRMVVESLVLWITKQVQSPAGGPVAIMAMSAEQVKAGWDAVFRWVGIISANLAVINMLPFPPFDGFRLVLIGWEGMIRRRIDAEKELVMTLAGFMVIVISLLILTSRDILNIVRYGTP